jgi:hypothetical protein
VRKSLSSLRLQKVQAVNPDLSPFTDPNSNPALHQMVAQMISEKVNVTVNEQNQPATDRVAASTLAGFPVQWIEARKDAPQLVVGGRHELNMIIERARLLEILKAAGHPGIVVPASLDGASFAVRIPRTLHAQYGTCPGRVTATNAIASQVIETGRTAPERALRSVCFWASRVRPPAARSCWAGPPATSQRAAESDSSAKIFASMNGSRHASCCGCMGGSVASPRTS